jgi:hypothetical protein
MRGVHRLLWRLSVLLYDLGLAFVQRRESQERRLVRAATEFDG